jgi:hypothetical protein
VLDQLRQLTTLVLWGGTLDDAALQSLAQLTRLHTLRLLPANSISITTSVWAGMQHLTALDVGGAQDTSPTSFHPAALAATPQLKGLQFRCCVLHDAAAGGVQALLFQLQNQTQLTHLYLQYRLCRTAEAPPDVPPEAYAALTASSQLRFLHAMVDSPQDIWPYVLPAGRQLPYLTSLRGGFACPTDVGLGFFPYPEPVARVVGCCPALRVLHTHANPCPAALLAPVSNLQGLCSLQVAVSDDSTVQGIGQLTGLTGFQELVLFLTRTQEQQRINLLPLTQLRQLTRLAIAPDSTFFRGFNVVVSCTKLATLGTVLFKGVWTERCLSLASTANWPTGLRGAPCGWAVTT